MTVPVVRVVRRGSAKKKLNKMMKGLKGPTVVRVGFPAGTSRSVLMKATFNEFGTVHIPERPFMRNAINGNTADYKRLIRRWAKEIINGRMTMTMALNRLGLKAQGDIQTEIVALRSPPNAPSTIARKGSSNPLIDTGEMRQKVTFKLGEK